MAAGVALWRGLRLSEHLLTGILLNSILNREETGNRKGRQFPSVIQWWHKRLCKILGMQLQVTGEFDSSAPLLVANHISWLDIPAIGAITKTVFLSKSEVRKWPVIGWLAGSVGTMFIVRGGGSTPELAGKITHHIVEKNRKLLLFPEGTTTDGTSVRNFFPRLFSVATESGIPVQPVAIRYTCNNKLDDKAPYIDDDTFANHLGRTLKRSGVSMVQICFCEPIEPGEMSRKELAEESRKRIVSALESMEQ